MNQKVSERPKSEVAPALGRIQPQVDDLSTPITKSASPADETTTPTRSRCGRCATGESAARRASRRMAMSMTTSPAKT